eukprot:Nk52_evm25s1360 gene=Nk52_evmTU25s1360
MAETIKNILSNGLERYNPEHLPEFEEYIKTQCSTRTYDCEANQAVLKLYQFNPARCNTKIIALVLLKAMMNLPSTDYVLSLHLVSEKNHTEGIIAKIEALGLLLETCQFKQFWEKIKGSDDSDEDDKHVQNIIKLEMNGFDDAIRNYVAHVLAISHQSIKKEFMAELLNLNKTGCPSIDEFVASGADSSTNGWTMNGDSVEFPVTEDNQVRPKRLVEKMDISSFTKLMVNAAL